MCLCLAELTLSALTVTLALGVTLQDKVFLANLEQNTLLRLNASKAFLVCPAQAHLRGGQEPAESTPT